MGSARAGVTLLEAVVALVIIGTAFTTILTLQAQLTRSLDAVTRANERALWRRNAVEVAASLGSEADRTGALTWRDGATLEWRPDADAGLTRPNRTSMRQAGVWKVHLAPVAFTARTGARTIITESILAATADTPPGPESEAGSGNLDGAAVSPAP